VAEGMSTWVDVNCGECEAWLGDAKDFEGRKALGMAHFAWAHPREEADRG
jgi:hypothetical protein